MLEGITILNQEMITTTSGNAIVIFGICLVGVIVFLLLFAISRSNTANCIYMLMCFSCVIGMILVPALFPEVESGRYRYEVIIDESVSFSDIYEKYDVIEQRGEIWVLEEKGNVD